MRANRRAISLLTLCFRGAEAVTFRKSFRAEKLVIIFRELMCDPKSTCGIFKTAHQGYVKQLIYTLEILNSACIRRACFVTAI